MRFQTDIHVRHAVKLRVCEAFSRLNRSFVTPTYVDFTGLSTAQQGLCTHVYCTYRKQILTTCFCTEHVARNYLLGGGYEFWALVNSAIVHHRWIDNLTAKKAVTIIQ